MHPALENLPGPERWFHHGDEVLLRIEQQRPTEVVELGTLRGASAIAIARVIQPWGGHVTTMDIDEYMIGQARVNVMAHKMDDQITVWLSKSADAASERWPKGKLIDCLYIDADHEESSVLEDLESWWPHLRVGALVMGDDYDNPMFPGVTTAWDKWEAQGHPLSRGQYNPNSVPPNARLIYGWKTDV